MNARRASFCFVAAMLVQVLFAQQDANAAESEDDAVGRHELANDHEEIQQICSAAGPKKSTTVLCCPGESEFE